MVLPVGLNIPKRVSPLRRRNELTLTRINLQASFDAIHLNAN